MGVGIQFCNELIALTDLLLKASSQGAQRQVRFNACQNFLQLEGFGDVIHASGGEGFDLILGCIQGADEDNRNISGLFLRL